MYLKKLIIPRLINPIKVQKCLGKLLRNDVKEEQNYEQNMLLSEERNTKYDKHNYYTRNSSPQLLLFQQIIFILFVLLFLLFLTNTHIFKDTQKRIYKLKYTQAYTQHIHEAPHTSIFNSTNAQMTAYKKAHIIKEYK